jgi:spore maturation protein CgeB
VKVAFFASSLVSSYWNGAATYYRGIVRALHERGHWIDFYEPDAYARQQHRDLDDPDWARVVVYQSGRWRDALECAADADVVVKASGVGVNDAQLEAGVLELDAPTTIFWDVDAPATLARVEQDAADPFAELIPQYDLVLTYGGGDPVVDRYHALGARACVPVYNALDPETHHPVAPQPKLACDLAFLGNRLPDREARVEEFFFRAAERAPAKRFLLGGAGWDDKPLPPNVIYRGHTPVTLHNAVNCSALAVLNVTRQDMVENGWSPPTRVFEAAGAGACVITDAWEGVDHFLEPGHEVLVAESGAEVAELLATLSPERAREVGEAARRRLLEEHTYAQRAEQVESILAGARA